MVGNTAIGRKDLVSAKRRPSEMPVSTLLPEVGDRATKPISGLFDCSPVGDTLAASEEGEGAPPMALNIRKHLEGRPVWLVRIAPQPNWGSRKVARRFPDLWAAADAL
jgi:hypothetical protein